ncbi:11153_t:CDS:2, partial [Dentiscutata heterogama]
MSYRNTDVDILDEDQLFQHELFTFAGGEELEPDVALRNVQAKGVEVRNFLTRGNTEKALTTAIENPPYGSNTTEAK